MYSSIEVCRACGSDQLEQVFALGDQALTGVFPRPGEPVQAGPVDLLRCRGACGLVQLRQTYDQGQMYGDNYGYRSGLNAGMVRHLQGAVAQISALVPPRVGDLILDIGSNDGTLLRAWPAHARRLGIDPTGEKFRRYYPEGVELVADFFSAARYREVAGLAPARIVTSFSMFYDLPAPLVFMREVAGVLADDGVWVMEQSYLPRMLAQNSYDTICHEHLEFYALQQIAWMAERAGLEILRVSFDDTNGGSFRVYLSKPGSGLSRDEAGIHAALAAETALGLASPAPFEAFRERVEAHRRELRAFLAGAVGRGELVVGIGASTKGNVLLQYCGIDASLLPCIAEVNSDKFGCVTPGTGIPIISEDEAMARGPAIKLILPWHFRSHFLEREAAFLEAGGRLLFPLPTLELVGGASA